MSKTGLCEIFAGLPDELQRYAILSALDNLFARSEWEQAGEVAMQLIELEEDNIFRATALSIGVKAAIRLRQFDQAFERYALFSGFERQPEITSIQAATLLQLAIPLLPYKADKLCSLWDSLLYPDMPPSIQRTLGKIGLMLKDAFIRTRNRAAADKIMAQIRKDLPLVKADNMSAM